MWLAHLLHWLRVKLGKEDATRKGERFGRSSVKRPAGRLLWFHAASIGESVSILVLVRQLGKQRPDLSFLMTTGTLASAVVLASQLPPRTVHQFVPYDVTKAVTNFLDYWRPDVSVFIESELWPNLICESYQRRIPLYCINARMSDSSYRRWKRFLSVSKFLLNRFEKILVQDDQTADRLQRLGLENSSMEIVGSLKRGATQLPCSDSDRHEFMQSINGRPLWIAASTHHGEEMAAVKAHQKLSQKINDLLLIIVPRHPSRGLQIAEQLHTMEEKFSCRSQSRTPTPSDAVYIADTVNEMGLWYRISPVSFIGGSLVAVGGHNPFEPAALKSAIIHGPHVTNFIEIYKELAELNAAICIQHSEQLAAAVAHALQPKNNARLTSAAASLLEGGDQITARVAAVILRHIPSSMPSA